MGIGKLEHLHFQAHKGEIIGVTGKMVWEIQIMPGPVRLGETTGWSI